MAENNTYRTVNALSLPLLDQDGKPRADGKEYLVQAGQDVQLTGEIAQRALKSGSVRELTDEERAANEPEQAEGSEVNGPGTPEQTVTRLERPADGATKDKWAAYASQEGVDPAGKTRDEIRTAVDEKAAAAEATPEVQQ